MKLWSDGPDCLAVKCQVPKQLVGCLMSGGAHTADPASVASRPSGVASAFIQLTQGSGREVRRGEAAGALAEGSTTQGAPVSERELGPRGRGEVPREGGGHVQRRGEARTHISEWAWGSQESSG